MLIREAVEKDVPSIVKLLAGMDGEGELDAIEALEVWNRICRYPYYKIFVAQENEKIVGSFSLIVLDNLGHCGARPAIIENVMVDENYRGHGVGKLMMEEAMELARKEKCYKLALSSNKRRLSAHDFYRKLGFEQHGFSFVIEDTGGG